MLLLVQQNYQCRDCRPIDKTYKTAPHTNNEVVIIEEPTVRIEPVTDHLIKTQEKDGVIFTEAGIGQFNRELLRVIGSKRRQPQATTQKKPEETAMSSPSQDKDKEETSGVLTELEVGCFSEQLKKLWSWILIKLVG